MKTKAFLIIVISAVMLISCKSKRPKTAEEKFETIKAEEVDPLKKTKAYNLGRRLLEACNTSRFKAFSPAEATEKVIKNATAEKISVTCQKIIHRNGKFIDMTLLEVTHNKETDDYVFRYDIKYEKKYFKRELNVTIDTENKVSAINTKEVPVKPL